MQLKFKKSYETEIFITQYGFVRIGQLGDFGEENYVLLTLEQMRLLKIKIDDLIFHSTEVFDLDDEEGDE